MLVNFLYLSILSGLTYCIGKGILTLFKSSLNQDDRLLIFIVGLFYLTTISVISLNIQAMFFLLVLLPTFRGITTSFRQSKLSSLFSRIVKRKKAVILYVLVTAVFALIGADAVKDYDAYLYHLQTIHWLQVDPLVVGIANLHQRLAFNSVWFNLQAQLSISTFFGYPLATLNVWIVSQTLFYLVHQSEAKKLLSAKLAEYLLPTLLLILSAADPLYRLLRGYSPDAPIIVLIILFFHQLILNKKTPEWFITLFLLSVLAIWIKVSALPLIIFVFITGVMNHTMLLKKKGIMLTCMSIFLIWLIVFTGTNIMKSGYALYPVSSTRVQVYWAESVESVKHLSNIITSWGKIQAIDSNYFSTRNFDWIPTWIQQASTSNLLVVGNALLCIFLCLLYNSVKGYKETAMYSMFLVIFLVYWFVLAPDFRFGLGALLSGIYFGIQAVQSITIRDTYKVYIYLSVIVPYILIIPFFQNYTHWIVTYPKTIPAGLLNYPVHETYIHNKKYYVPQLGDDRGDYSHFPSSPKIHPCLKQKNKGVLTVFSIDCD